MSDYAELIKTLRTEAKEFYGMSGDPCESELFVLNQDSKWQAADAIEALRASLANEQRAREECESRNVFLETEIVQLAERVRKS
jgi:hypothetical protein